MNFAATGLSVMQNDHALCYSDLALACPVTPAIDRAMQHELARMRRHQHNQAGDRLCVDSRTITDRTHSYGRIAPPVAGWVEGTEIEVARIASHNDDLTILRKIETNITNCDGKPIARWFSNLNWKVFATWRLYYTPLPGGPPLQWRRMGPGYGPARPMPYTPVYPRHSWNDNRFIWGNSENLQLPLLPGYNVSLVCQLWNLVPPNDERDLNFIEDWKADADYRIGDVCRAEIAGDDWYLVCTINHNSGAAFDIDYWSTIASDAANDAPTQFWVSVAGRLTVSRQADRTRHAANAATEHYAP